MANTHISQKTSFLTSILTSWDGTETRQSLRREPRRYIAYDYTGIDAYQSEYLRSMRYAHPNSSLRFPLWHAAEPLKVDVVNGQLSVAIPTHCFWSFHNIGGVLFWSDDIDGGYGYDLKRLSVSNGLTFKEPIAHDWSAIRTLVIPVAYVVPTDTSTYTGRNDDVTETTAELELVPDQKAVQAFPSQYDYLVDEPIPETWGFRFGLPTIYNDVEVFRYEPQWDDNLDVNIDKLSNRIDYDTGVFRYDTKSTSPVETRELTFVLHSKQMINNFERFFYRCKGAWKSFYAPSWLRDFELYEDALAGETELHVKLQWYWKYYNKTKRRHKIVVFFTDSSCMFIDIMSFSRVKENTYGVVFLENPLERNVIKSQVKMICFFNRYRFDSDDLTIDFETVDTATTSVVLREVDE